MQYQYTRARSPLLLILECAPLVPPPDGAQRVHGVRRAPHVCIRCTGSTTVFLTQGRHYLHHHEGKGSPADCKGSPASGRAQATPRLHSGRLLMQPWQAKSAPNLPMPTPLPPVKSPVCCRPHRRQLRPTAGRRHSPCCSLPTGKSRRALEPASNTSKARAAPRLPLKTCARSWGFARPRLLNGRSRRPPSNACCGRSYCHRACRPPGPPGGGGRGGPWCGIGGRGPIPGGGPLGPGPPIMCGGIGGGGPP